MNALTFFIFFLLKLKNKLINITTIYYKQESNKNKIN